MPTPNFEEVENKVHQYLLWDNWAGLFEYLEKALHQVAKESYNQGVEDSIEALPGYTCAYDCIEVAVKRLTKLLKK